MFVIVTSIVLALALNERWDDTVASYILWIILKKPHLYHLIIVCILKWEDLGECVVDFFSLMMCLVV